MNYFLAISSNLRLKPKLMRVATIFVLSVPGGALNGIVRRLFASSEAVGKILAQQFIALDYSPDRD
jgi:hypothetical protein